MSFRKIKPTKISYLSLQKRLKIAERGKFFLEFKCKQYILEIKKLWVEYSIARKNLIKNFKKSILKLNKVYPEIGWMNLNQIIKLKKKINKPEVRITYKKQITNLIPQFNLKESKKQNLPVYSLLDTNEDFDDIINSNLPKFFKSLIRFAEIEESMLKYAENYKIINRRINSLDKILIPKLIGNISKIKGILEELDRENYVRLKKTKDIINKAVIFQ